MIAFALACLVLIAATLVFLLPALLRVPKATTADADDANLALLREQRRELERDYAAGRLDAAAYGQVRMELQRRAAREVLQAGVPAEARGGDGASLREDTGAGRALSWTVGLVIPLAALALYVALGNPLALIPAERGFDPAAHAGVESEISESVARLAARLQREPDDQAGWFMLARSYVALGEYRAASDAYARLLQWVPNDADVLADYADALGMAQGQSLQGEPERLIARALAIDGSHLKALALSGSAAFERGDYARAEAVWQRLVALAPPQSDIARATLGSIEEARARRSGEPAPVGSDAAQASGAPAASASAAPNPEDSASTVGAPGGGAGLSGVVDIDPALRKRLSGEETVFVFARAASGPRAPLAVLQRQVKDLPFNFTLDDSMSMTPQLRLSEAGPVVVGARVSLSGSANPDSDDPQGSSEPVKPSASGIQVRISARGQERPAGS